MRTVAIFSRSKEVAVIAAALVVTSAICNTSAKPCRIRDDPCVCQIDSEDHGGEDEGPAVGLNLTALATAPNFRSFVGEDGHQYGWDPCGKGLNYSVYCSYEHKATVCQLLSNMWWSLGNVETASFEVDTTSTPTRSTLKYSGGTDGRKSSFTLVCDASSPGTVQEIGEDPEPCDLQYNFIVTSKFACLVPLERTWTT